MAEARDSHNIANKVKSLLEKEESLSERFSNLINIGAERAILSLMINSPSMFQEIKNTFIENHFYNLDNKKVFNMICWISDNRCNGGYVNLDQINYEPKYSSFSKEKSVYISALKDAPFGESGYKAAKSILLSKYSQRQKFALLCESMGTLLNYNGENIEEVLMIGSDDNFKMIKENMDKLDVVEKVGTGLRDRLNARAKDPSPVPGIPLTKFPCFSDFIGGLKKKALIVGAARPKRGKSTMQFGMAIDVGIHQGLPVGVVESEMDRLEQEDRLVACLSSVETKKIENGLFVKSKEDCAAIKEALDLIEKEGKIYIRRLPIFDTKSIISSFRLMKALYDIKVGFFDQIKDTMDSSGSGQNEKESQRLGWLALALKLTAEELDIPIVANMQLSRSGVDAQLASGDIDPATVLADSDKVLRQATTCFLIRKKTDQEIIRDGGVLKGGDTIVNVFAGRGHESHSWTGGINYIHRKRFTRFEEVGNIDA